MKIAKMLQMLMKLDHFPNLWGKQKLWNHQLDDVFTTRMMSFGVVRGSNIIFVSYKNLPELPDSPHVTMHAGMQERHPMGDHWGKSIGIQYPKNQRTRIIPPQKNRALMSSHWEKNCFKGQKWQ